MKKITPCLWFDGNGEEAVNFYTSIFPNSKILNKSYYGKDQHGEEGSVLTINFEINGQKHMILNGGPQFKFSEAVSFSVECETQEEIDYYWEKLKADGGEEVECGWLRDKFGLSWQIPPVQMETWISSGNDEAINRAMQAMMKMVKLDLAAIQQAYEGKN